MLSDTSLSEETANKIKIRKLKKVFNNRLIVIDEVQNIRISDDNKKKKIAINLMKLLNILIIYDYYYCQLHQCIIVIKKLFG